MYLKQSTAATIKIGPFLDDTDGKTAETGLTLSAADVRLTKNGGDMAAKNEASSCTHDELGWYDCDLDATDTGTLGRLKVMVAESGALPVWHEFTVLAPNVYDALVGGGDTLEVDAVAISGDTTAADNLEAACDGTTYNIGGGAITAASVTGAVGSVTGNVGGNVAGSVDSVTDPVTVGTNNDKTGYALSASGIQAIWDALTGALTTAGSIGKRLVDYLTGDIYGRLGAPAGASVSADLAAVKAETAGILEDTGTTIPAQIGGLNDVSAAEVNAQCDTAIADAALATAAALATTDGKVDAIQAKTDNLPAAPAATGDIPTVGAIADGVWDEAISGHLGAGTTGNALNAAGSAGDPWSTPLPGAYGAGTAGKIIGANINAPIGTIDTVVDAIQAKTDNLPAAPAATGDIPTVGAIADGVWDEAISGHLGAGTTGNALNAAGSAGDPWSTPLPGAYGAGTAGKIIGDNLNAPIGTIDTVVDAIKTVTDQLPDGGALTALLGNVAAILTDTGTTLPGTLDTIAAYLDTEIAAILADTNELQGDLANGGRLDLLIDAIKAVTDALPEGGALTTLLGNVAAILTDTGTTLPASMTTIEGKIDAVDAVADAIQVTTDKLDDTLENDAGTYRFSENALEQAPAGGGGGDATAANQALILEDLEDIKGTGFVANTNSLTKLSSASPVTLVTTTSIVES